MALNPIAAGQFEYLRRGGPLEMALKQLRGSGALPEEDSYVFRMYPKMLFDGVIVTSEEEEDRVLAGGKTSDQLEEERLGLIERCRSMRIQVDPDWTVVRLRRELGDKMDAPEAPNKMAALESELAALKRMAAMQAEIDALKAQLSAPADEADTLRAQLASLGREVDRRWSVRRLREELERATDPEGA